MKRVDGDSLTRLLRSWTLLCMSSGRDEVAEPNTPSGVIAGTGRLARGLGQPAYHGSTFRMTVLLGLIVIFTIITIVTGLLARG